MKALIVEDDSEYQKKFMEVLKLQNISSDLCIGAVTAIDLIEKNNYDLLILDLKLAEFSNGIDVLEYLRKAEKFIPVLIISGYTKSYEHLLIPFFSNEKFFIGDIDKNISEIQIAKDIKRFIGDLECRFMKTNIIPDLNCKIVNLENKVNTLEEINPNNWDLRKELKDLGWQIIVKNKRSIAVIITSLAGLIITSVSGISMSNFSDTAKIIQNETQSILENISEPEKK